MKLNEYLTENGVKLMIKGSGEKNPTRQTNNLGMYDYVENLENVLGKMAWICDYRANAERPKDRFVTSNLPPLLLRMQKKRAKPSIILRSIFGR